MTPKSSVIDTYYYWGVDVKEVVRTTVASPEADSSYAEYLTHTVHPRLPKGTKISNDANNAIEDFYEHMISRCIGPLSYGPSGSTRSATHPEAIRTRTAFEEYHSWYLEDLTDRHGVTSLKSYRVSPNIFAEVEKIQDTAWTHDFGTLVLSNEADNLMARFCPNLKSDCFSAEAQDSKFRELYQEYKKMSMPNSANATGSLEKGGIKSLKSLLGRGTKPKPPPTIRPHDSRETIEVFMEKEGLGVTRISQATADVCPWLTDL